MSRRVRFFFLGFAGTVCAACSAIPPYSGVVPVPRQTLLPPSADLIEYTDDKGLSAQLERTTTYCGEVKQAIAREIDQRERRLVIRRNVLVAIGSVAALVSTVYAGVEEDPSKDVTVPLGAISGTALLAALPSLGKDERAEALREKLGAIKAKEASAITAWSSLERGLLDISLLRLRLEEVEQDAEAVQKLRVDLDQKYVGLAPVEEQFRAALAALSNECS